MNSSSPIETVQSMYAAFGRGDVSFILAQVHPKIQWRLNADLTAPGASSVAAFRPAHDSKGVGEFFAALGRDLEFHVFQPTMFFTTANGVACRVQIEWTHRGTKKRLKCDSLHVFTFDAAGKLTEFREFTDTLAIAAAFGVVKAA